MTYTKQPFHNLDEYIQLPRLGSLALSPDGSKLVSTLSTLSDDETKYNSALWQIDPQGTTPARRLTFGENGESQPSFSADGDLIFLAKRGSDDAAQTEAWLLPQAGGEARTLVTHPNAVQSVTTFAHNPQRILVRAAGMPNATDLAHEAKLRAERKDKKISAILHTGYPVRFWDADLGPSTPHFYTAPLDDAGHAGPLTDLTPLMSAQQTDTSFSAADNGEFLITEWVVPEGRGSSATGLMKIDLSGAPMQMLLTPDETYEYTLGKISPDSSKLIYARWKRSTPQQAPSMTLWLMDLANSESREIAVGWDRWTNEISWLPNERAVLLTADDHGHSPIFRLCLDTDRITRLTAEGAYSNVLISPDSTTAYALRASYAYPTEPVAIELEATGELPEGQYATIVELLAPTARPELPGTLSEVHSTAEDGSLVRAWLATPHHAGPEQKAPLLLWVHGGPLGSWNAWSWRWNPWLAVAQGYAVLLPDPALSTGYGQEFIQRGWGRWGAEPYTDLLAITDQVVARADIDETRTAAMGGSFGGYMANWIAGHTDRFKAIVTHASLWALDGFDKSTDASFYWTREMDREMIQANSPHHHVAEISTPMLVIHGDKDYRVPISEGLKLWYQLLADSGLPQAPDGSTEHQFLYFPDENHWILAPQHAKIWYQVVFEFFSQRVLGHEPGQLPEVLG